MISRCLVRLIRFVPRMGYNPIFARNGRSSNNVCSTQELDRYGKPLVPLAGIEPALLAELDFESSASTNSATGASGRQRAEVAKPAEYSGRAMGVNPSV